MGIYQKGKNWYIDYYVKGHRKRKMIGPSKKLAELVLKDVHLKNAREEYLGILENKKILFDEFAKKYLDYSKTNKSPATYERSERFSAKQLTLAFKGKLFHSITPVMIEEYKAARLQSVTPASVNRELACLKYMYTKAIEWGYVKVNPAKQVKLLKEPPGRLRYLKPEEVDALLKACASHIHPIVVMALNTGMRKSEILNLRWQEVDLGNRKITVANTKNNEKRVIPINQTLYKELSTLQRNPDSNYVFLGKNGLPVGDIKKGFLGALKRAGIVDFRFHDLRHTFGSQMIMQGVDIRTVQQIMGHKTIKMTMRYSHLSPEYVEEAMMRLDNVWTPYGRQANSEKTQSAVSTCYN
jgi:integrase